MGQMKWFFTNEKIDYNKLANECVNIMYHDAKTIFDDEYGESPCGRWRTIDEKSNPFQALKRFLARRVELEEDKWLRNAAEKVFRENKATIDERIKSSDFIDEIVASLNRKQLNASGKE
jgi:hypothetical protein